MHITFPPPPLAVPPSPRRPLAAVLALVCLLAVGGLVLDHGTASAAAGLDAPVGRFSWPLPPPHVVLRPFRAPATPYGPGHRGVDLAGSVGEAVLAAADGAVVYAGPLAGCPLVSVEHTGGLRTTYVPVDPLVGVGDRVARGQPVGRLRAAVPGCPQEVDAGMIPAPVFLYWGVHRGREYLDPIRLVRPGPIRLLPWPADG